MDVMVTIPDGTHLNGAIAELYEDNATGWYHAEVRIPAPADHGDAPMRV